MLRFGSPLFVMFPWDPEGRFPRTFLATVLECFLVELVALPFGGELVRWDPRLQSEFRKSFVCSISWDPPLPFGLWWQARFSVGPG